MGLELNTGNRTTDPGILFMWLLAYSAFPVFLSVSVGTVRPSSYVLRNSWLLRALLNYANENKNQEPKT